MHGEMSKWIQDFRFLEWLLQIRNFASGAQQREVC
jgi:hypothetical protein